LKEDHPGALLEILTEFAVRGVNLTTIQSRPTGEGLGNYFFFIDCEGHIDDTRVGEAMVGLRRVCAEVRFFGSYPRSDGGRTHVRAGTSNQEFAEALAWLGRLRFGRALSAEPGGCPPRANHDVRQDGSNDQVSGGPCEVSPGHYRRPEIVRGYIRHQPQQRPPKRELKPAPG
jgi:hypothetical protein